MLEKEKKMNELLKRFHKEITKEPKVMDIIKKNRDLDVLSENIKMLESLPEIPPTE